MRALHRWLASQAWSLGQVSSGEPAGTGLQVAELAGDVAGHAGAVALRGGLRAADPVDAVPRLAGRRAGRRAARAVGARRGAGDVLPDLLPAVGGVGRDVPAEHQGGGTKRIEDLKHSPRCCSAAAA